MQDNELILDHPYTGELTSGASCQHRYQDRPGIPDVCGQQAMMHANPGPTEQRHLVHTHPHAFVRAEGLLSNRCAFTYTPEMPSGGGLLVGSSRVCGYPEDEHSGYRVGALVRQADAQQYEREPMPDAARRGIQVTLIDAPFDPLGTLAAISGIYEGKVHRSKHDMTDEQRRAAWDAMMKTVLSGPLEAIQFTFLIEGLDRALTHQLVRNRFGFYAQESLRFAVPEDWAQEVPLPPGLAGKASDDPAVAMWRKALNQAEDNYAALVGAGMAAEEARGVLPHAITTRIYVTWSLRTVLMEAGKRTCTQAQFPWRVLFGEMAKAFRARAEEGEYVYSAVSRVPHFEPFLDNWQYELFASALRPVCYQTGRCGFKAEFDRACSIRDRVDAFERTGTPSSEWENPIQPVGGDYLLPIYPREWAADPSAARVVE